MVHLHCRVIRLGHCKTLCKLIRCAYKSAMAELPNVPVCILAGGASRRFGSNKALAKLQGKPLVQHILERLRVQTRGPIALNVGAAVSGEPVIAKPLAHLGLPILPDNAWEGSGPLAGIFTALEWGQQNALETVLTVAVDLPFVPLDLIERLQASGSPAFAATLDRWHPVNGIWKTSQIEALAAYLESGRRSAHGWAKECSARVASFDQGIDGTDPFWNVNTPDEMAHAEQLLS